MSVCSHPKEHRSLLAGYDVVCGDCQEIVGRVALFPCAVLDAKEAKALLDDAPGYVVTGARSKLEAAARLA